MSDILDTWQLPPVSTNSFGAPVALVDRPLQQDLGLVEFNGGLPGTLHDINSFAYDIPYYVDLGFSTGVPTTENPPVPTITLITTLSVDGRVIGNKSETVDLPLISSTGTDAFGKSTAFFYHVDRGRFNDSLQLNPAVSLNPSGKMSAKLEVAYQLNAALGFVTYTIHFGRVGTNAIGITQLQPMNGQFAYSRRTIDPARSTHGPVY